MIDHKRCKKAQVVIKITNGNADCIIAIGNYINAYGDCTNAIGDYVCSGQVKKFGIGTVFIYNVLIVGMSWFSGIGSQSFLWLVNV